MKNLYTAFFAAKITIKLFYVKNHHNSSYPAENRPIAIKISNWGRGKTTSPYAHVWKSRMFFQGSENLLE